MASARPLAAEAAAGLRQPVPSGSPSRSPSVARPSPSLAAPAEGAKVEEFEVAGSFELPPAVATIARSGRFDAVVPLGCLIRGETAHFDVLAHAVARSLAELAMSFPVAIPFGVLTCETIEQARARSSPEHNVGAEAMEAALELVALRHAMAPSTARASRSAAMARPRSIRTKRRRSPGSR